MKPLVAGLLTAGLVAAMLVFGSGRPVPPEPQGAPVDDPAVFSAASPAGDAVRGLLRSGEAGDVSGYLAAFTGPLKARLEREVDDRGREAFAADLTRSASARKGHAIFDAEPESEVAARVVVEMVYPDRNERQAYRVVKAADGWRIADVAIVKAHQPTAKFGAPAGYLAPEGVPVEMESASEGRNAEPGDAPEAP